MLLATAVAAAFMPGIAGALELGEISSRATLGQNLSASIELGGVGDLGSDDVLVSLASADDFERLGVDRNVVTSGLSFTADIGRNGRGVIHVKTSRPVREPYLNFVLQVVWPQGRLVREFTVLLDPPSYVASPVTPPAVAPLAVARAPQAQPLVQPASAATRADSYRIQRNDALWDIASRNRPAGGVSVMQTMAAIQRMNPDAFVEGNINRLKVGQVLRLPSEQQAREQSHAQAVAQVEAQSSQRQAGRNPQLAQQGRQLDATHKAEAGAAPAKAEERDNLRLVSGQAGKERERAAGEQLAVAQEGLDSARREGDELRSRISDLEGQTQKLNKLIELKDSQIAGLLARLAEQERSRAQGAAAPAGNGPAGNPQAATSSPDAAQGVAQASAPLTAGASAAEPRP
ncbi:pilus assembly protein FimV [Pseudomonas nitritireducens]|uniref:Pilus assembly protein FimV n=1 Tax=Pseudomonas nitroreducens TaxID=46680 RepID=A0A7W7KIX1_PSENT|nr:FimV/HubP family polar landmark protein [Pseudomonas nitritireducens]MBB4863650.1 pilus assembly protein FimV [Pseudomonas nitritireducens]